MNTLFSPSERTQNMLSSSTLAAAQTAAKLRSEGIDVIDFGAGEPDFITPKNICDAAKLAIDKGKTKYTSVSGISELKSAITSSVYNRSAATYDLNEIILSAGGKQTIFNAITTLINSGDEVIIPSPYWVTYPEIVTFAGGKSVFVSTEDTGFQLTAEKVKQAITPHTKLVIVNSPNNPSGRVIDVVEFTKIAELVAQNNLWMISDECYYQFVYSPNVPFSATNLSSELRKRIMISASFSKTYAMTGWRIGYALADSSWVDEMGKLQSHSTSNPTSFVQWGALEAIKGDQSSVNQMLAKYEKRRNWLIPSLNEINGIECLNPEGAFYAFPSVKKLLTKSFIKTDEEFAALLLEKAHVMVTPGSAFGEPGYLRISYATSLESLQQGVDRVRKVLSDIFQV